MTSPRGPICSFWFYYFTSSCVTLIYCKKIELENFFNIYTYIYVDRIKLQIMFRILILLYICILISQELFYIESMYSIFQTFNLVFYLFELGKREGNFKQIFQRCTEVKTVGGGGIIEKFKQKLNINANLQ